MLSISDLLKNHRIPGVKDAEIRQLCALCAEKLLSYPVSAKQVRYKDGALSYRVPSIMKSEILLKQDELKRLLAASGVTVVSLS